MFLLLLFLSYSSFSFLILSSFVVISFYIHSKRFYLKLKRLSDAIVVSFTKNEYGFTFFVMTHKVFKVNI